MLKIALFPNPSKDRGLRFTSKLIDFLSAYPCEILLSDDCFARMQRYGCLSDKQVAKNNISVYPEEQLYQKACLGIVLGGDGTLLHIGKKASKHELLILGINLGKIGYISELEGDELHLIEKLLQLNNISELSTLKDFSIDNRMMLETEVIRNGKTVYRGTALNDVVISKGSISKMIDISIHCSNRQIAEYRADGVILSTPTGSTAYCMSAGGPIIDPSIECICMIPVCPYLSLNSSPVIFSSNICMEIIFHSKKMSKAYITIDGRGGKLLNDGDIVRIKKSPHVTKLLRIKNIDFYKLLRTKLSCQIDTSPYPKKD